MPTKTPTMFETRNDLPAESREKLVELLNARLADSFDLYSQIKQAHWSVRGPDFIQLHLLYDTVAERVLGFVDEIAERAAALGGLATGTVRMGAPMRTVPHTSIQNRRLSPRMSSWTPPLASMVRRDPSLSTSQVTSTRSTPRSRHHGSDSASARLAWPSRRRDGRTE